MYVNNFFLFFIDCFSLYAIIRIKKRGGIMRIGQKIKELRISNGLSQKSFADKIGISLSSVQKYEYGDFTPSNDVIARILRVFNISIDYFIDSFNLAQDKIDLLKWDIEFEQEIKESLFNNKKNIDTFLDSTDLEFSESERMLLFAFAYSGFFDIKYKEKEQILNISFYPREFSSDIFCYDLPGEEYEINLDSNNFKIVINSLYSNFNQMIFNLLILKSDIKEQLQNPKK